MAHITKYKDHFKLEKKNTVLKNTVKLCERTGRGSWIDVLQTEELIRRRARKGNSNKQSRNIKPAIDNRYREQNGNPAVEIRSTICPPQTLRF
jgi:hypothetical protein